MGQDSTKPEDNLKLVEETRRTFGRVDILLPIAGVNSTMSIPDMTEEEWNRVMDINLKGVFWGCQAVFNLMREQRYGKIVTIASVAGKIGGITSSVAYSTSKAGVVVLTYSFAKALAPYGCNVNCISPGPIETPFHGKLDEGAREMLRKNIPLGRWGKTDDIVKGILFLCSDAADFITGEVLDINGGMLMD
ncbi:MAG: SDR family oxidoreductase [Armatimonadetes bacterium]|nr:SDR family oxidoreductase [Armatimonadota bacterium]